MYTDLFSEYRRVYYASENFVFYPGFNRLVIFYIELIFFTITKWLLINPEELFYLSNPANSEASLTEFLIFAQDPSIFRHAFIMKLPYFIFDLCCAGLIWKYFKGHRLQVFALFLWLFNPVTIYATYLFGRFEVIGLFFLIATAYCLKTNRVLLAALVFGLAVNCREIYVLFLPAFFLALIDWQHAFKQNFKRLLLPLLIVVVLIASPYLFRGLFDLTAIFTKESNLFEVKRGLQSFFIREFNGVYPFFLLCSLCYFGLINRRDLSMDGVFVIGCLSIILPYFMVGFHSAHYFTWAVPFLLLVIFHVDKLNAPVLVIFTCWLFYWLFYDQRYQLTPLSAVPLDESFFGRKNFAELFRTYIPIEHVIDDVVLKNISRTICIAAMAIVLYRAHYLTSKN